MRNLKRENLGRGVSTVLADLLLLVAMLALIAAFLSQMPTRTATNNGLISLTEESVEQVHRGIEEIAGQPNRSVMTLISLPPNTEIRFVNSSVLVLFYVSDVTVPHAVLEGLRTRLYQIDPKNLLLSVNLTEVGHIRAINITYKGIAFSSDKLSYGSLDKALFLSSFGSRSLGNFKIHVIEGGASG